MLKKLLLSLSILFLFTGCSQNGYDKPLRISTTTWIGYIPLYYAKEKGWLKPLNIELSTVVSLSENLSLYRSGNFDAYVGTQYEYDVISQKDETLLPVIMFDRSNGGDIVMANQSIKELQAANAAIDVYLEMDSINKNIFDDFVRKYDLGEKTFNYINKDQSYITTLKAKEMKTSTIIITYNPYNLYLEKTGFQEVASTKDGLDLFVIDAMFTKSNVLAQNKQRFEALKKMVDKSIEAAHKDPEEFYNTIKDYLESTGYEQFKDSLNDIVWINKDMSPELEARIMQAKLPVKGIIR